LRVLESAVGRYGKNWRQRRPEVIDVTTDRQQSTGADGHFRFGEWRFMSDRKAAAIHCPSLTADAVTRSTGRSNDTFSRRHFVGDFFQFIVATVWEKSHASFNWS